jgi:hypothetical protein
MGILEQWGITLEELDEILLQRPSVRGILIGFLAEYKATRSWLSDARIHHLKRYDDHDRTRPADFGFTYQQQPITVEVKSLQTHSVVRTDDGYRGSAQVDASDKRPVELPNGQTVETTCLVVGKFDLLAVNLFEFGQTWRWGFVKNADLPRSRSKKYTPEQQQYLLATAVKVSWPLEPPFRSEPFSLMDEIIHARRSRPVTYEIRPATGLKVAERPPTYGPRKPKRTT